MGKKYLDEIALFIILVAASVTALAYYFYKANFRFDPYYDWKISQEQMQETN